MKLRIQYRDQAKKVMDFVPDDGISGAEHVVVHCQIETIKIVKSLELRLRGRTLRAGLHRVVNRSGTVRVWLEIRRDRIICFAIEISHDGGRTYVDPLREDQ